MHSATPQNDLHSLYMSGIPAVDPRVEAPRTLTERDVAALIINKMIGTGVFTGPYLVLSYTQNKAVAMTLWAVGFLYTLLRSVA